MRGQRLFTRPIEPGDADAIREFLEPYSQGDTSIPGYGLLGKIVGELVAVAGIEVIPGTVLLRDLFVARHLRRKRIGRFMVDELARLAQKLDCDRIVVQETHGADAFLQRIGFLPDGDVLVRRIART